MKIVHTEASCGWGGQEIRILAEAAGLARRGHELLVAAPPESRIFAEAGKRGLPARALPIARKSLAGWRAIRALLRAERADAINTHSSTDSWLVALARLGMDDAPPVVRTRHISAPIPGNFLSRWLYRGATAHIVTTGEALRQQVIEQGGADPRRVTSVPTGIDLSRFRAGDRAEARAKLALGQEDFLVGIVATLRSWKGHLYLLEALPRISGDRVKVIVVGAGPMEDNIRKRAEELGIASRVITAGQQEDVVPWLQSFDAFALPSYANEGVPQAIMQAMACGLPVLTTGVGAIGEIARDGETALVVEPRDAGAIAAAIRKLRDDPSLRARLGGAAAAQVRSKFSEEAMLDRMEATFRSVVSEKSRRGAGRGKGRAS